MTIDEHFRTIAKDGGSYAYVTTMPDTPDCRVGLCGKKPELCRNAAALLQAVFDIIEKDDTDTYDAFSELLRETLTKEERRRKEDILKGVKPIYAEAVTAFAKSNMRINRAAKAIYVSTSSMHYRLGRVKALTDYDPYEFKDLCYLTAIISTQAAESQKADKTGETNNGND